MSVCRPRKTLKISHRCWLLRWPSFPARPSLKTVLNVQAGKLSADHQIEELIHRSRIPPASTRGSGQVGWRKGEGERERWFGERRNMLLSQRKGRTFAVPIYPSNRRSCSFQKFFNSKIRERSYFPRDYLINWKSFPATFCGWQILRPGKDRGDPRNTNKTIRQAMSIIQMPTLTVRNHS